MGECGIVRSATRLDEMQNNAPDCRGQGGMGTSA